MLGQVWALAVVKWQILRHTFSTGKAMSIVVGIAGAVLFSGAAVALGVGLFLLSTQVIGRLEPLLALLVLDALVVVFLMLWLWGLLLEIQRTEIVDLRKMLYLPVSLGMVFVLNFLVSLLGVPLLLFAPGVLGLFLGLGQAHGLPVLWAAGLAALFFLMLSAWAYYLRGVLAMLMENKRRRRLVMTVLPIFFVVLAQVPSAVLVRTGELRDEERTDTPMPFRTQDEVLPWVMAVNHFFPPAWLPLGVWSLLQGRPATAALCGAGMALGACLGLCLGYRSTLRYYRGAGAARAAKPVARRRGRVLTGRRLVGMGEDTGAVTFAAFLSFARHPNIRMMLLMPICLGAFFLFFYGGTMGETLGGETGLGFSVFFLVWPFMNFGFVMLNQFGIDRQSFRALVLLPTPRHRYLLAKNAALFPFVGGLSLLFAGVGAAMMEQPLIWLVIAIVQVFQVYFSFCLVGNFTSIYFPYRIHNDGLRGQNNRPLMMLVGIGSALVVALLMLPTAFCLMVDQFVTTWYGPPPLPIGLLASMALLGLTAILYAWGLRHAGDLLLAREQRILEVLVRDRE